MQMNYHQASSIPKSSKTVIIGAGPSGVGAMYGLSRAGHSVLVIEKNKQIGGIARTENHKGFLFDVGGHRFFTKNERVDSLWRDIVGNQFLNVNRISSIFYNGRYFRYPLKALEVMTKFGLWESVLVALSYLRSHLAVQKEPVSLEEWLSYKFGVRLYQRFFQKYSEKVWGLPCHEIASDWASQRINGLSLLQVVPNFFGKVGAKSLIESFCYPVCGTQTVWERFVDASVEFGL